MQSNVALKPEAAIRLHVGIIMDGNGRWATRRGLSRLRGHEAGVEAIRRIVEAAPDQGVGTLTLYAFSSDNWRRPKAEVAALMGLLRFYLANEIAALVRNGVRLTVIGRRDRLPDGIAAAITRAEAETAGGTTLHLRIAIDYSARDAILNAAARAAGAGELSRETFADLITGEAGAARRRSDHPHLGREAAVGLPALGGRLCRAALHRADVARIRCRRSRRRTRLLPSPRAPLRRTDRDRAGGGTEPLKHDPEKCEAVFRKDHAQTRS
ncbi:hypothetical protein ABIF14_008189 [Bradyrhizobium elkanii]